MKRWSTQNGYVITQVLSGRSNAYLISKNNVNILADTGKENTYKKLRKNIASACPENPRIDILILTHTRFDHCRNAARIGKTDGCKIIAGEKEREYIKS